MSLAAGNPMDGEKIDSCSQRESTDLSDDFEVVIRACLMLSSDMLMPERNFPWQVIKYLALLSITPSFFRLSKLRELILLAERIRCADRTPIPGILNRVS